MRQELVVSAWRWSCLNCVYGEITLGLHIPVLGRFDASELQAMLVRYSYVSLMCAQLANEPTCFLILFNTSVVLLKIRLRCNTLE